ncbi:MAG: nucleotide exchange factor GrpE [Actinobacteria bacterium]|nr:nucleotide exchange factor GrpE [Actinomycetota bacterium]NCV36554.1 nucleotide exchange factor GrpE [Actinomycetota bacterium]NCV80645.1 nucleotide exchange factor GrpE [Actinomycetota bacterium]NCV98301.1 nucleotide exchange factor GrpE [Actinomycetota bacterium]NCW22639.1 nucleotide exchange factor GrpE [Actinomycetota bacterium]
MPEENLPEEPAKEPQESAETEEALEETEEVSEEAGDEGDKDAIDRELEIFQDLQRLQADFVNYRARVERDRGVERQLAVAEAIRAFLPAMDDLTRAEAHGDLQDGTPMAAIAQKLRAAGEKFGLSAFGEKGEAFDPEKHEALVQNPSEEVTKPVIADVIELGYMVGDRLLRPAKVAVSVPADK